MNLNSSHIEVEKLKKEMISNDWERMGAARRKLVKIGCENVLFFLIGLLKSEKPSIQNQAALGLRSLKDNRAIGPLLEFIFDPENHNQNGTMVYALQTLDCKHKLVDIFKILFHGQFEAKLGAYNILSEQIFEFNRKELFDIQNMWNECNKNPNKYDGFNNEKTKSMMQDAYEGFIMYLENGSN